MVCIIFRILLHSDNGLNESSVMKFCENLYTSGSRSPYLLAYLVDAALEKIESNIDTNKSLENSIENQQELAEKAVKVRARCCLLNRVVPRKVTICDIKCVKSTYKI